MNFQLTKNSVVEVVDSCMGSSKSTKALEYMDNNPQQRYIYVSPLLSEVEQDGRVPNALQNIEIFAPTDDDTTKSEHLFELIKQGANICCTHSLYSSLTDKHFNQIAISDYVVIIDEEISVIENFNAYSDSDTQWLVNHGDVSIREQDGMMSWIGARDSITNKHKYFDFIKHCDSGSLYCCKRSSNMLVTQLPIRLFECAKRVIVLTYLFKDNILDSFLKLKGFSVTDCPDIIPSKVDKQKFKELLNVIPPTEKMLGLKLSSSWWDDASTEDIKIVRSYTETTLKKLGVKGKDVLWTVPKRRAIKKGSSTKNLFKPRNFCYDNEGNSCYLSCMTRATNNYAHKNTMVHLISRNPVVSVNSYLQDYGSSVSSSVFALSEMLQWLWRGCIRKGEPMNVVIGSERMYWLFMNWLNDYDIYTKKHKDKTY